MTPGQRRRGRPKTYWHNNIMKRTGLSGDSLLRSVEDRTQWRKIVHEVVNPRIEDDWATTSNQRYWIQGTVSAISWSRLVNVRTGVGYGTLSHSKHCVERWTTKVHHGISKRLAVDPIRRQRNYRCPLDGSNFRVLASSWLFYRHIFRTLMVELVDLLFKPLFSLASLLISNLSSGLTNVCLIQYIYKFNSASCYSTFICLYNFRFLMPCIFSNTSIT